MKKTTLCIFYFLFYIKVFGQTIGGVINIYTPVTGINCNKIDVVSSSGFSAGERVLLIQMKGAVIDTSNTLNFGTIANYNNCGNYEFATISTVTGNSVFLQKAVLNNYTISGYVQLIRVPQYVNATVGSSLTCLPWNGLAGGVLVFEVSGTLTLNSNIDVSGKGFRGGTMCQNPDGSCGSGYQDHFYPVTSGFGAEKGEGIAKVSVQRNGGRGPLGNGGGGGNKHNTGGAGGGNYTKGGLGGKQANFCPATPVGGTGGNDLNYSGNKLFLGGGGGCSDNNNGVGTPGTNGGGIVIISANTINGNSKSILSHAPNQVIVPNSIGDGSGGGGAGGAILMNVLNYASAVSMSANGGNGGGQNTSYSACFGPGGGGGTGIICLSNASTPANVTIQTLPGTAGLDMNTWSSCYNTSYGATGGIAGVGLKYNAVIPENTSTSVTNVNLGNDISLTCGQSAILNAGNPGAGYIWSTGATSPTITVTTPGNYWVTVSACGGTDSDTIQVSNVSNPITVILGRDTSIACNQSLILNSRIQGASYIWSTGATTSSITIFSPGQYWVTVNLCSATDSDTLIVSALNNPITIDLGNDMSIACNQSVVLNSGFPGGTYLWSTGATTSSITVSSPGQYWVAVSSCSAGDSDTILVSSSISPTTVDLGTDRNLKCTQGIMLSADVPGATYLWSTGSTSSSILVTDSGSYWVFVDACGTSDSDTILVSGKIGSDSDFEIPNVITPNGDGVNDIISLGSQDGSELNFAIYNRWGQKVAADNKKVIRWNGYFKNEALPAGTYFWVLEYNDECSDNEKITKKGYITVFH